MLNITGASRNLVIMSPTEKNSYLRVYSTYFHQNSSELDMFYCRLNKTHAVLWYAIDNTLICYNNKIQRLFVPKFYHEERSKNFLKTLKFIGEWGTTDKVNFSEFPNEFGRKLYEYQKDPAHLRATSLTTKEVD